MPSVPTASVFKVGDKVRVDLDVDKLKTMQEGHGGWNARMANVSMHVNIQTEIYRACKY